MAPTLTLRLEVYAPAAKQLIGAAQTFAEERGHAEVEPAHLLAMLLERDAPTADAIAAAHVVVRELQLEVEAQLRKLSKVPDAVSYLSQRFLDLLGRAEGEAARANGALVDTGHLLIAIAQEASGAASVALKSVGLSAPILRAMIANASGSQSTPTSTTVQNTPEKRLNSGDALSRYGRDLTRLAAQGKFDPMVLREEEMQRIVQVLARRRDNSPVLVGDAGIGKSTIIEGLAARIAANNVPSLLTGKRIVEVEIGSLIAGARLRGELEDRMRAVLDAARDSAGEVILFVPELGALFGERAVSAAELFAQAIERAELRVIAVASTEDFKKMSSESPRLFRRFVPIFVEPPTPSEATTMLRSVVGKFEEAHGVRIADGAVVSAVKFAKRYVQSAQLPRSAVDLIDEAAARVRVQRANPAPSDLPTPDDVVEEEDVAAVVSAWTKVPATKMLEAEADKLLRIEERLGARVIGQDTAISALGRAIRRGRAGLRDQKRPIGSFLFLGPTGVGKTELAKALAEFLFDDETALTRLDMSEFMEKHTVARLLGSPPGYVDSDEGGFLTEAVRRKPFSVVLFDEIEKAHPDVFNILLQTLDEGRLTDSRGKSAQFADTVVILTSNIGGRLITDHVGDAESLRIAVDAELKKFLRPELLNRIDEIVAFNPLSKETLRGIVDVQVQILEKMLAEKGMKVALSDAAKVRLTDLGYDPAFGARPLKRAILKEIQDPLAEEVLRGSFAAGDAISIDFDGNHFTFSKRS